MTQTTHIGSTVVETQQRELDHQWEQTGYPELGISFVSPDKREVCDKNSRYSTLKEDLILLGICAGITLIIIGFFIYLAHKIWGTL